MGRFKVLVCDYAWSDLEIELRILDEIDAELVIAPDQTTETLARLSVDADAIMTCWAKVPRPMIEAASRCGIVARFGIGLDNIDVDTCTNRGIVVTNVPDYCWIEVAEHTLALILTLVRKTAFFHLQTQHGQYDLQAAGPLRRIEGQTLGIVGLGNIGRAVAERALALGINVIATSRSHDPQASVEMVELNELLARSDYVSLHLPLTAETKHLIGPPQFDRMKSTAYLINTARGDLVDHAALAAALARDQLAGAALDVQSPEPPDLVQPPYNDPRVIVTPHAAFASVESLTELRTRTARQVAVFLTGGRPENVVNPAAISKPRS